MRSILTHLPCRVWRQNLIAGLTGLFTGSLIGCALILWTSCVTPVVLHETYEIDGRATRNGHLEIYVNLDRNRDCPSETSRWLWNWVDHDGERVKQFYPLLNTTTSLSELGKDQRFILNLPIPPGIQPGSWYYWSKTVEHCPFLPGFFYPTILESSDIPVQIKEELP